MSRDAFNSAARAVRRGPDRDAGGMTIDERRAHGIPLVRWHSMLRFAFVCPYWPDQPSCGIGAMFDDFPTEDAARKAWRDHAGLRHKGRPVGWPAHVVGRRPPAAAKVQAADPVGDDQEALF